MSKNIFHGRADRNQEQIVNKTLNMFETLLRICFSSEEWYISLSLFVKIDSKVKYNFV